MWCISRWRKAVCLTNFMLYRLFVWAANTCLLRGIPLNHKSRLFYLRKFIFHTYKTGYIRIGHFRISKIEIQLSYLVYLVYTSNARMTVNKKGTVYLLVCVSKANLPVYLIWFMRITRRIFLNFSHLSLILIKIFENCIDITNFFNQMPNQHKKYQDFLFSASRIKLTPSMFVFCDNLIMSNNI